jgi:hypothetical protein
MVLVMDALAQTRVIAQIESLLIAPLFERTFSAADSLGGLGAEVFAREIARALEHKA